MSDYDGTLQVIIKKAIENYLEENGYFTISPNLTDDNTQRELSTAIRKAIQNYMGSPPNKKIV
jgi:hypothetical protein